MSDTYAPLIIHTFDWDEVIGTTYIQISEFYAATSQRNQAFDTACSIGIALNKLLEQLLRLEQERKELQTQLDVYLSFDEKKQKSNE